jgi:hypothetical protein
MDDFQPRLGPQIVQPEAQARIGGKTHMPAPPIVSFVKAVEPRKTFMIAARLAQTAAVLNSA